MKPSLPPQSKHIRAGMDSAATHGSQEAKMALVRGASDAADGEATQSLCAAPQHLTPFIERLDAAAVVEGWHNNVLEHIGGVKHENVSGGGLLLATYILQGVSGLLPLQLMRSAEYMESLSHSDIETLLESQPGLAQTLSKSISSDSHGDVALKVVEIAFSWLAYEMQEADGCGRFVAYLAMAVLTLLEMPGLQPPNYELLTTGLPPVLRAAKRMAAGRAIYDCTACATDRKPIEVVLMVIRRLAEVHQPAASLVCASGLTPFLVKLLSEDELTTKQALHLIDLQLREQVSFQDVHELYMLDYTTSIPSPHLRTCQLLVGLNTAARLVQIVKGTSGSAEPWVTDTAACVLAHIALHKQLQSNLTDAIPAVVAALCKEIDTEEQLCDGDVTCEYVCQPAVEFLAHMASQSANLIDIGLANGIEALARAVAVEPGKQRVTERSILALNLIASGGPSFSNAVARWRNVTNFRNQIDRYVAAQAPLSGPRLDAYITAHQAPLAELEYENICRQAEVDFSADGGTSPSSPQSAFVTCAASLTEGGQTSSHADDTRALMTVVLLGGISQDDLMEYMSCFGGLSPVLSNIGHVLKLHCGTIVCAPGVSGQEGLDPTALAGSASVQDLAIDAALGNPKGDGAQSSQHMLVNGGVPALKKRNSSALARTKSGSKSISKAPAGAFPQPDVDSDSLNMLPTEEELLTCDCPFCVAYRGRSDSIRGAVAGATTPSCAAKAQGTNAAAAGARPAQPLVNAQLKDPLAQGFKATAVIGISCKATPVYRTNDPFTFKINDFKLPSDLVDDIVNKRYPACLAVLITESLELEGLWVPSASPNIKDKDGSDVLQFQRFRVFHPLPKQAHHGILKTLWDKRVQWNQGLNARRTKQLLQAFLDQDVRLGIPSQALPLPATAPRPAVTAPPVSSSASTAPSLPAASAATTAAPVAAATPTAVAKATAVSAAANASAAPSANGTTAEPQDDAQTGSNQASRHTLSPHSPLRSPGKHTTSSVITGGSTPVAKQIHQRKPRDQKAAASQKLAAPSVEGQQVTDPSEAPQSGTPQPDFTPLTPTSTTDQSDAMQAATDYRDSLVEPYDMPSGDLDESSGADLPNLPSLHLSKAQHRSVRTDDGEEVHVLVSPVRSQAGDESPSSPSRLPDSVLKAMCNMGKAFLSRASLSLSASNIHPAKTKAIPQEGALALGFTSGPKSSIRSASDDGSLDSPSSASGGQPTSPHWAPLDTGLSRSSAPNPSTSAHTHVPSARRSSSMRAEGQTTSPSRFGAASDTAEANPAGATLRLVAEAQTGKDFLRPAQNGLKPHQRTGSVRPATRTAAKALPLGLQRNPRRPSSQDTARVQAVARNAAAQSVPPGVVDLIAAAQREIDAASASAEQLIRENDFAEDGLDLNFDAFLESDGIAELVAQAQGSAGSLPPAQHTPARTNAHARRAHSPAVSQTSPAVTPPRANRSADPSSLSHTPASPAQQAVPGTATLLEDGTAAATKPASGAAPTAAASSAVPEAGAQNGPAAATAAAGTPGPAFASTTAGAKELPKGNAKQKRAHKNADAIRARLKQRLEAAQEGVSTEDGSSSVTSGLDEDQAAQADMMMRRLVKEEEERLRREGERAFKRQQKTAESALPSGLDNPPEETSSPLPQQPAAADTQSAVGKDGCRLQESQQNQQHQQQQQQNQQQQQQQQPQAKSQAAAAPAPKLTKAQRQRQKRLAKQALSVEQSAQSAPSHLSDTRFGSPDDSAWETVIKKGNKGGKTSATARASTAAQPATASTSLQPQLSSLSQTGRTMSGALPPGPLQQPSGMGQTAGAGHSSKGRALEAFGLDGGLAADSVSAGHDRSFSQDDDALSSRSSLVDPRLSQQLSVAASGSKPASEACADVSSASQEAAQRAGLVPPAPAAKASNWAGLLKAPQHQPQQPGSVQDWQEEEASSQSAAPVVFEDAFPQLATAANSAQDNLLPSQHSVSDLSLSFEKSQSVSRALSEAELHSVPSSPFASMGQVHQGLASEHSQTTADSTASGRELTQDHITQQLHANAAIWGTGLSSGTLSGIQLPSQQQASVNPFQAASTAVASSATPPAGNPWDPQPNPQATPCPTPSAPSQAPPKPVTVPVKSLLPANAQPFIPRLSTAASQGQRLPFASQQLPGHPQAPAMSQQQPGSFLPSHSFGRSQQPSNAAVSGFNGTGSFDGMQQTSQLQGASRGYDGSTALQQMQRQRLLQQQQQGNALPQQKQQQQLADIWLQPNQGVHQNGTASRPSGAFAPHQQPSGTKGKPAANGPFAAHQPPASAFLQHQPSFPQQQQYNGLQQQQQQSRGSRSAATANGAQFGAGAMNGMTNGHLSSTGPQSEDDELLSGVFTKVWEDNLQESQDLLGRQSPEASMSHSVSHMPAVPPKDIAAAWNLAPADMHGRVDAAAAFNNNSSYSTAFLNTNGFSSKLSGSRPSAPGPTGQLPQPAQLPQGGQVPQAAQTAQPGYSAVHTAPFRPRAQHLPAGVVCPLTKQVMRDPVTAADGHTYERGAIVHWMHAKSISPVTHQPLPNKHLTSNAQARSALTRMKQFERAH